MGEQTKAEMKKRKKRKPKSLNAPPQPGAVHFHVSLKLDMDQLRNKLRPIQLSALMEGIATALGVPPWKE